MAADRTVAGSKRLTTIAKERKNH